MNNNKSRLVEGEIGIDLEELEADLMDGGFDMTK